MSRKRGRNSRDDDIDLGLDDFGMDDYSHRNDRRDHRRRRHGSSGGDSAVKFGIILILAAGAFGAWKLGWLDKWLDGKSSGKPVTVVKKHGTLRITSIPAEANVFIDGTHVGKTPFNNDNLKTGVYKIRVEKAGHHPFEQDVQIDGGKIRRVTAKLEDMNYGLTINTVPRNARIQILDIEQAYEPGIRLKPGKYRIKVSSPGYRSRRKDVVIFNSSQSVLVELKPTGRKYRLRVDVKPKQAQALSSIEILETEREYGRKGISLVSGDYTVEVKTPGYQLTRKKVSIAGRNKNVSVRLKGKPVSFIVEATPSSSKIRFLNFDKRYREGMRLMPGKYEIEVSARGYRRETHSVTVTKDKVLPVRLELDIYELAIRTKPKKARIRILSPQGQRYSRNKKYKPGKYKIEISKKGYRKVVKTVRIKKRNVRLNIKLEKIAYRLNLTTVPRKARIKIMNRRFKYRHGMKVTPGKYVIEVSAEGYRKEKRTYRIKDESVKETIRLREDRYLLSVRAEPSNSVVRIVKPNIRYKPGMKLKPGKYTLEISAPGYKPERKKISITENDVELKVKLGEESYGLTVKTTPSNASVKILEYPVEYVPGVKLIPGQYQIEVSATGYATTKKRVTITDRDENVFVLLKEQNYKLTVETEPKGAKISLVDYRGEYSKDGIELAPGRYIIRATRKDYRPVEHPFTMGKQDVTIKLKLKYRKVLTPDHPAEPTMIVIPAGSFRIGSSSSERGRSSNEGPQSYITFKKAFAISKTEVTFKQYGLFAKATGRGLPRDQGWGRGNRPVINVTWNDAYAYVRWLSKQTGKNYSIPSEAQWEYAAKAGSTTPFHVGKCITPKKANYDGDYNYPGCAKGVNRGKTIRVGSFAANRFGLQDMHGNVWEWTDDCWNSSHGFTPKDGSRSEEGRCGSRVIKGGAWDSIPREVRSSVRRSKSRNDRDKNLGFRIVRTLD